MVPVGRFRRGGRRLAWGLVLAAALAAAPSAQETRVEDLLRRAEEALVLRPAEAVQFARSARAALGEGGDRGARVRALALEATAEMTLLHSEEALRAAEEGLGLLRPTDPPLDRVRLAIARGTALGQLSRSEQADQALDAAVALGRETGDPGLVADALIARGTRFAQSGRHREALGDLTEAVRLLEAGGTPWKLGEAYGSLGLLYDYMNALDEALVYDRKAAALFESEGGGAPLAAATFNIARVLETQGDMEGAFAAFERSRVLSAQIGDTAGEAYALHGMGVARGRQERYAEGLALLGQASLEFERLGDGGMIFASLVERSRLERGRGRPAQALALVEQAMAPARRVGGEGGYEEGLAHREMALVLAALGRYREAHEHLTRYIGIHLSQEDAERDREVRELRVRFDTEQAEARSALLAKEKELADLSAAREAGQKRLWAVATLLALGLAGTLAAGLWRDRRSRARLVELASTDELTGLPNRRTIFAAAATEFDRARRYGTQFAVGVADLDSFKSVNDHHGHAVGDEVLRRVAAFFARECRGPDHVGRIGGEEFLFLFPHTDADGAARAAERLREGMRELAFPALGPAGPVTLSVGVAAAAPCDGDLDALLHRADTALYQAKGAGRDRVVRAAPTPPQVAPPDPSP